jgi:hypothetical protein
MFTGRAAVTAHVAVRNASLFRLASALFLFFALLVTEVRAQILVCTDSLGRKEYSLSCPPGTVSQKQFRAREQNQQVAGSNGSPSTWQDQERAFQERRIQRESAEAAEAQKQKQQQNAERQCANSRRKMEQLQSGRRLRWVDKSTGERPVMTEEEHAAEMKSVEAELRQCRT